MKAFSDIVASVDYWEQNARWYQLWADHGCYHEPIIQHLVVNIQPHWRVLDIGAGNGVLSFPLAALGCRVTALEPSSAMRRLFFQNAWRWGIGHVAVDDRPWADFHELGADGYDLVMACNTLHVCCRDQGDAFRKVVAMQPRHIFVVSELGMDPLAVIAERGGYQLQWNSHYCMQSPHVYHTLKDAFEHWRFSLHTGFMELDERQFASRLRLSENHWYLDETVTVSLLWWSRCGES
jgi:SAM-dependent methyltransferase